MNFDQLKSLQSTINPRIGSYGGGATRFFSGICYSCGKKGHRTSECLDIGTGGNSARVESPVAFPAVMDVTVTLVRPFSEARTMMMSDGETWTWFADSGASYRMTSTRSDFLEYRELTDWLWVKNILELLA
jgi:hypothetical protein